MTRLPVLLSLLPLLWASSAAAAAPTGTTTLLDRPSGFGALPYDGTRSAQLARHSLSADGCFVVFVSDADELIATDDDGAENVYRQNRCDPGSPPRQVNTSAAGRPAPGGTSAEDPTISADGRYVAFSSDASLDPAARGADRYLFRKDMQTGAIVLVSRSDGASGAPVRGFPSFPVISGNGGAVVFIATGKVHAANADGVDDSADAYVRYVVGGRTFMASVKDGGGEGGGVEDGHRTALDVDYRGANVAFITEHKLDPADTDGNEDAYERQGIGTIGQHTQIVSFTGTSQPAGADSADDVAIASDGSHVAYTNGKLWISTCSPCGAATRVDQARTGGSNSASHTDPFFAQTGDNPPTHVFWRTASGLDPADLNQRTDLYSSALAGADPVRLATTGAADGAIDSGDARDDLSVSVFTADAATNLPGSDGTHRDVYELTQGKVHNLRQVAGLPLRVSDVDDSFLFARHAASDDGRLAVFMTNSPALGAPLVEGSHVTQAAARDTATGRTALVSVAPDGLTPADSFVNTVSVDGAGRKVAFGTPATNLVTGMTTSGPEHVYVRDLVTRKTMLVDRAKNGAPAQNGASDPQISGDGRWVVFDSESPDLSAAPGDGREHVYRLRLSDGDLQLVDRSSAGAPGNDNAYDPDIGADGRHVTFVSQATNLGGPATVYSEVYVRDVETGTTTWASVHSGTGQVGAQPAISGDGTRVAYMALPVASLAAPRHVFVRDVARRTTTPVTAPGAGDDDGPSLSRDGRKVAFVRSGSSSYGTYIRDLATGSVARADLRDGSSAPGRIGAYAVSLAGNGRCAVFESASDDLTRPGYGANYTHVFRRCAATAGAPAVRDTTAPRIRGLHMTHRRFRPHRHATAFVFRLSERARTRITVRTKHGKRRAVLTRRGTVAGRNKVAFSGRAHGRKLKPGRYRATVVATDRAGNRSHAVSVRFTVIRRR